MSEQTFTDMEMDAIGEIMNISFGASATAVSTMLGTPTNITTPVVRVENREQLHFDDLKPAIGVEISYVEGLEGRNVMMFSREDVRIIVGMMMGMEIPPEEFVFDEMNKSAICEIMNQMMGASATALSEFLGYTVNISTPYAFEIDEESFKDKYFGDNRSMVVCRFTLEIGDKLKSQFLNIMNVGLVKKLLEPYMESLGLAQPSSLEEPAPEAPAAESAPKEEPSVPAPAPEPGPEPKKKKKSRKKDEEEAKKSDEERANEILEHTKKGLSQSETDAIMARLLAEQSDADKASSPAPEPAPAPAPAPEPAPAPSPAPAPAASPALQAADPAAMDPAILQLLSSMQQSQNQMMALLAKMQQDEEDREEERKRRAEEKKQPVTYRSVATPEYDDIEENDEEIPENREMLMRVPLEISVEVGRTRKSVRDILGLTQGSLVVLDKMAGEQADLFVNGERIARGDIVVVEDNFGIRITEILNRDIVKKLM